MRPKEEVTHGASEDVGDEMYVGGLEVEEVEEGGGSGRARAAGPCRGGSREIGGQAVVGEDAGAQRGKRSGEDARRERLGGGPELMCQAGRLEKGRRTCLNCWTSLGAAVSLELLACQADSHEGRMAAQQFSRERERERCLY